MIYPGARDYDLLIPWVDGVTESLRSLMSILWALGADPESGILKKTLCSIYSMEGRRTDPTRVQQEP